MSDFRFDEGKSFSENCKAFLEMLESIDPSFAKILSDNWSTLVAIVHEGERKSNERSKFNDSVASVLDNLAKSIEPKDDS